MHIKLHVTIMYQFLIATP